jgi:protease-4
MSKTSDWIIGSLLLISLFFFVVVVFFGRSAERGLSFSDARVGVIEVNGLIYDSRYTVNQLKRYSRHKSIKSILLRIDSPGGVIAPTQEIYEEIKRVREEGTPVIASIGTVGASGGYYIACACDRIVANPGSITGSIGVIMEFTDFYKLLEKLGINFNVIKSGKYKDSGSPFRQLTEEEKALFQEMVMDSYDQFIDAIVEGRNLSKDEVTKLADGRVFTGRQAFNNGLIDEMGGYETALNIAREIGGMPENAKIYKEKRKKFTILDVIFSDVNESINILLSRKYNLKY